MTEHKLTEEDKSGETELGYLRNKVYEGLGLTPGTIEVAHHEPGLFTRVIRGLVKGHLLERVSRMLDQYDAFEKLVFEKKMLDAVTSQPPVMVHEWSSTPPKVVMNLRGVKHLKLYSDQPGKISDTELLDSVAVLSREHMQKVRAELSAPIKGESADNVWENELTTSEPAHAAVRPPISSDSAECKCEKHGVQPAHMIGAYDWICSKCAEEQIGTRFGMPRKQLDEVVHINSDISMGCKVGHQFEDGKCSWCGDAVHSARERCPEAQLDVTDDANPQWVRRRKWLPPDNKG